MSTLRRQSSSFWHSISCNYLLIPLFSLFIAQCKSQFAISSNKTYSYGSQFASNLNNVLDDLVQNTPVTGMHVSSFGEPPNRVDGLLQCRGDASQKECNDCCQNTRNMVTSNYNNRIECQIWLPKCELHYWNYSSVIANPSTETPLFKIGGANEFMKGGANEFMKGDETLRNLVYNLSIEASTSIKRFAAGASVDSSGDKIYGLVQCDRVISTANCSNCLSNGAKQLQNNSVVYGGVYMESCYVLVSNQSLSTNHSEKLRLNSVTGRGVLLVIALLLLLMKI